MYHSKSFYLGYQSKNNLFLPNVISAFKILVDESYFHFMDDEEHNLYPKGTVAFIRCTAGNGKIYTKHGEFELSENDYIFLNFHDIIKYKAMGQIWGYRWTNFTYQGCKDFVLGKIGKSEVGDDEEKYFEKLIGIGQNAEISNYVSFIFLAYYYNVCRKEEISEILNLDASHRRMIDDICSFISQKLFTKITVDAVSAFFNITPRRLHQIFIKELNISPKKYITKKKMEEGYRLLVQTSMPINKISELLCFSSPYHFTNEFKKNFNQTPTQVRNIEK